MCCTLLRKASSFVRKWCKFYTYVRWLLQGLTEASQPITTTLSLSLLLLPTTEARPMTNYSHYIDRLHHADSCNWNIIPGNWNDWVARLTDNLKWSPSIWSPYVCTMTKKGSYSMGLQSRYERRRKRNINRTLRPQPNHFLPSTKWKLFILSRTRNPLHFIIRRKSTSVFCRL